MQFRRIEVPSQGHDMAYPRFSYIIWTRKNYISFKSNNKQASKFKKEFKVKATFLYQCILELPYLEYGCLVGNSSQGGEEAEAGREEALMSNICLISHHWYDIEKLTVPGRSTLPEIPLWISTRAFIIFQIVTRFLPYHLLPGFCSW